MTYIFGVNYLAIFILAYGVFDLGYFTDIFHSLRGQLILMSLCFAVFIFLKNKTLGVVSIAISVLAIFLHFIAKSTFDENKNVNSLHTKQINLNYSNQNIAQHLTRFNKETWDLLVLFEFADKHRELFADVKPTFSRFGYKEIEGFPMGIGVISRYPIIYRQVVHIESPKTGYVLLKLLVNEQILNLVLVHPPSPRTNALWNRRNKVLEEVSILLNDLKGPWLVVGDLNTVPWSDYVAISQGKWCYDAIGFYYSWVATKIFQSKLVGLPIDHCITSTGINIHSLNVTPFIGSDHLLLEHSLSF
jgi:endonuclease/exonuclease/phosphatase (EEP) superfamily protein YafD